jgi:hypothetical protein
MKFLASIRRFKKSALADDTSIDDSSVYTTGLQSRGGLTRNSIATQQTSISDQVSKQKRRSPSTRHVGATTTKSAVNKSQATAGNESISGNASLESYYNNYALPNQEFSSSARFEGGPLANNISSKNNAPAPVDPPPPLTPINSMGSSSRSGLFSLKSADSKRSTSTKSIDAGSRYYATPRMGSSRKTHQQRVDKAAPPIPPSRREKSEASSRRLLLALGGTSSPTSDEQDLRLNLAPPHHDLDEIDGSLPNLCASTTSKLVFGNAGSSNMLPCSVPSASDKSTVMFDNRRRNMIDDDDYNYDFPHADDESTIDVTLGSKINMTDQELMDERNASPGVIRLTAEGLKSHTEMKQDEIVASTKKANRSRNNKSTGGGYDAWKCQREERKYYRAKYEQRDDKLEEKIMAAKERAERSSSSQASKGKQRYAALNSAKRKPLHQSLAIKKKEEGVDLLSVAPMETLNESVFEQDTASPSSRPSPFGSIRRKKIATKLIPKQLLEAERQKEKEAEAKKKQDEEADFARIQKRRENYLKQQREVEAKAREERKHNSAKEPIDAPLTPATEEASTNSYFSIFSKEGTDTRSTMSSVLDEDTFTISTTTSSQPCVVCMKGERTHIAMPCMHYSFCEDCVESMQCRGVANCPVCKARRVSFTKVFF